GSAINEAARDGIASDTHGRMGIFVDGFDIGHTRVELGILTPWVANRAFECGQAEVSGTGSRREEVDLLHVTLPDISDVEVARDSVEGELPWITQSPVQDMREHIGASHHVGREIPRRRDI